MIDAAKEIIQRGIELNDQGLVDIGVMLLRKLEPSNTGEGTVTVAAPVEVVKSAPKRRTSKPQAVEVSDTPRRQVAMKKVPTKSKKSIVEQFTLEPKPDTIRYVPVRGTGLNTWSDDGSECVGEEYETPSFKPAKRTRNKPQKVEVFCGIGEDGKLREDDGCGKSVMCSPELVREFFLCDDCLLQKRKGR